MAIEIQVLAQVVDSDTDSIIFKGQKITVVYAPENTPIQDCMAVAKAKMGTTFTEVESDLGEQMNEALEGVV